MYNFRQSIENVTLELVNKFYLDKTFSLKKEYKLLATESFDAEASFLDFSQPEQSAKIINSWVDEATHNKIDSIVDAGKIVWIVQKFF